MVEKCKVEGCDNPAGKSGYCKKHFGEKKIAELKEEKFDLFKKLLPSKTIEVQPAKPTTAPPTPPQEEKRKFSSAKEELEELKAKDELRRYKEQKAKERPRYLEEKTPRKKIGAFFKQRGITTERLKKPIGTDDLLKGLGKGFDKFADKTGQRIGVSKDVTKNALLFAFYFPVTVYAVSYMLLPVVEPALLNIINLQGSILGSTLTWLRSITTPEAS